MSSLLPLLAAAALAGRFFGADPYRSPDEPHFGSVELRLELLRGVSWTRDLEGNGRAEHSVWQPGLRASMLVLPYLAVSGRVSALLAGATTEDDGEGEGYVQRSWLAETGGTLALRGLRLGFFTCPVEWTQLRDPRDEHRAQVDYAHWSGLVEVDLLADEGASFGFSTEVRRTRLRLPVEVELPGVAGEVGGWMVLFSVDLHTGSGG